MFEIGDKVIIKRGKEMSEHMAGIGGMLNHMSREGIRQTFGAFHNKLSTFQGDEFKGIIHAKGLFDCYIVRTPNDKYYAVTNEYNEMELIEDE
jgi:hypothetical protein